MPRTAPPAVVADGVLDGVVERIRRARSDAAAATALRIAEPTFAAMSEREWIVAHARIASVLARKGLAKTSTHAGATLARLEAARTTAAAPPETVRSAVRFVPATNDDRTLYALEAFLSYYKPVERVPGERYLRPYTMAEIGEVLAAIKDAEDVVLQRVSQWNSHKADWKKAVEAAAEGKGRVIYAEAFLMSIQHVMFYTPQQTLKSLAAKTLASPAKLQLLVGLRDAGATLDDADLEQLGLGADREAAAEVAAFIDAEVARSATFVDTSSVGHRDGLDAVKVMLKFDMINLFLSLSPRFLEFYARNIPIEAFAHPSGTIEIGQSVRRYVLGLEEFRARVSDMQAKNGLAFACKMRDEDLANALLDLGYVAPLEAYDSTIREAAEAGFLHVIEILLSPASVDPSKRVEAAATAAGFGHLDMLQMLVARYGVPIDADNNAIVVQAAGSAKTLPYVLAFDAVDPTVVRGPYLHDTPLGEAVRRNNWLTVKLLLEDRRSAGIVPTTAMLVSAAKHENKDTIKLLFDTGRVEGSLVPVLIAAVNNDNADLVRYVLETGRVEGSLDEVLVAAARRDSERSVRYLLDTGSTFSPAAKASALRYAALSAVDMDVQEIRRTLYRTIVGYLLDVDASTADLAAEPEVRAAVDAALAQLAAAEAPQSDAAGRRLRRRRV